jgi:hypothetical protein
VSNNGQESDSWIDDNPSTDDESSIGEAPDDSDYQVPPQNAIVFFLGGGVGGGDKRLGIPYLKDCHKSQCIIVCGSINYS